jgi:hypothetical protein
LGTQLQALGPPRLACGLELGVAGGEDGQHRVSGRLSRRCSEVVFMKMPQASTKPGSAEGGAMTPLLPSVDTGTGQVFPLCFHFLAEMPVLTLIAMTSLGPPEPDAASD